MEQQFDSLIAGAPAQEIAEAMMLYGQFVGDWGLSVTDVNADGSTRTESGEWHFRWVLGGRAIQDVWATPTLAEQRLGRSPIEHGTTVRVYDRETDSWQVTWNGPVKNTLRFMTARAVGGEIVQSGELPDGRAMRWVFHDIAPDRFRWRSEVADSAEGPWSCVQRMEVWRIATDSIEAEYPRRETSAGKAL